MLEKFGAEAAAGAHAAESVDCRSKALELMSKALAHLDRDRTIPPAIGAQLQTAIDALWTSASSTSPSSHLH